MDKKAEEVIDLKEPGVIVQIPEDAVKLRLVCSIIEDDKLIEVEKTLSNREIFEAHQEWEDKCETFVLTEEGREYVKSRKEDSKSNT